MSDIAIQKEITDLLPYLEKPKGKIFVVELRKIFKWSHSDTNYNRTSRTALYIEYNNTIVYPVVHFYKNRGIRKIYTTTMVNRDIVQRFIKEVGDCYLNQEDIISACNKLIEKYTLERFYHNIPNIFSSWIKIITKKTPPLIPDYETSTVKSKSIKSKKRKESSDIEEEEEEEVTINRTFFFGIQIDTTKDQRELPQEEIEKEINIRKDFSGQFPRFKEDAPKECILI